MSEAPALVPAPPSVVEAANKVIALSRASHPIYDKSKIGNGPLIASLMKEAAPPKITAYFNETIAKAEDEKRKKEGGNSNIADWVGIKAHPFDMGATTIFRNANGHHSTCLETKIGSTCGLGFKSDKPSKVLDPLVGGCAHSFQDVLGPSVDDFWNNGNGYLEVVRNDAGKIAGIHHIEARRVFVWIEQDGYKLHYYVLGVPGATSGDVRFAKFGDLEDFKARNPFYVPPTGRVSELIHFRRATALNRHYGFPDWLAAVAAIELVQMMHQEKFDFHLNRGVPEFMLFIIGAKLPPEDWAVVETALKATIGLGNSHKTLALNLVGTADQIKVQVERLAVDGQTGDGASFAQTHETLSMEIVSAHRIPPLLAGIVIPGRLGSNNELPNALMSCQALVVGPAQHTIQTTLGATLGNDTNGGLGLSKDDFEFNTITEFINTQMAAQAGPDGAPGGGMAAADTIGRMRQPLAQAKAEGRNIAAGVKKEDDLSDAEYGEIIGQTFSLALNEMVRRKGA